VQKSPLGLVRVCDELAEGDDIVAVSTVAVVVERVPVSRVLDDMFEPGGERDC